MRTIDISSVNLSLMQPKKRMRTVKPHVEQPTPKAKKTERVAKEVVTKPEIDSLLNGRENAKDKKETAIQQDKHQRIVEIARKRREAKNAEEAKE